MSTLSDNLFSSEGIKEKVSGIKDVLKGAQKKILNVRAAQPELKSQLTAYIQHLNQIRGRNLYYNYVGSGLGRGPYVELADGSIKIDLINGIGIHLFGHSHPEIIEAGIFGAMQDVVMQGNLQPNREYGKILELLLTKVSKTSRLRKGWISTCGTIANENALKISRQKNSPAKKILAFKDNFAGRSTLMAEITDNAAYKQGLPKYDEVLYLPFFDKKDSSSGEKCLAQLRTYLAQNPKMIACFVVELVQGEGGFNVGTYEFFAPLFEECRKNSVAVWVDEIQTFARTGQLFAFETIGLGDYVDLVTLAKTAQCAATLYTEEYNPKPGLIAGTFTSSTVSLATGYRILQMLTEGYAGEQYLGPSGKIAWINRRFTEMLSRLSTGVCKGLIQDIDGIGLMVSMTPYDGEKPRIEKLLQRLFEKGIIAFSCGHGPYKLRFLLPLVLEQTHINEIESILGETLKECAD